MTAHASMMGWTADTVSAAAAAYPVTLDDAKDHLREFSSDNDRYITLLIKAATSFAEAYTWRAFITQTRKLTTDYWPSSGVIKVPKPPLQSVTAITYIDTNGDTQTWSSDEYDVDIKTEPGRVVPAYGYLYPSARSDISAIEMTYKAGYGDDPVDVPEDIRHAIKLLISHYYDIREPAIRGMTVTEVPLSVRSLLDIHSMAEYG